MHDLDSVFTREAVQLKVAAERNLIDISANEASLREALRAQVFLLLATLPDYKHDDVVRSIELGHFWLRPAAGDYKFVIGARSLSSYSHVRTGYMFDDQSKLVPLVVKKARMGESWGIQVEKRNAIKIAEYQRSGRLKGLVSPQSVLGDTRDDVVVYESVHDARGECTPFTSISADDDKIKGRNIKHLLQMLLDAGRSLQEMHECGLSHQDFMDEQLFVSKDGLKVGDFGSVVSVEESVLLVNVTGHNYVGPYRFSPSPTAILSRRGFYRWCELFCHRVSTPDVDRVALEFAILTHFDTVAFMLVVMDMLLLTNGTRRQYEQNNIRPILLKQSGDINRALQIGCQYYFERHRAQQKNILDIFLQIWQQSQKLWTLEPSGYTLSDYIHDVQTVCALLPDENSGQSSISVVP